MNQRINISFLLVTMLIVSLSVFAQEEVMEEGQMAEGQMEEGQMAQGHHDGGAGLTPLHATSMILLAVVALAVVVISWKASNVMGGTVGGAIKLFTTGLAILVATSILEISFHFGYISNYSPTTDHFLRILSLLFFGIAFYKMIKMK